MQLSRNTLPLIIQEHDNVKKANITKLQPERVLQFGTGVLLRGLVDFVIHKANANGHFNGSVVMVKSTGTGNADTLIAQDNIYTVSIRGKENKEIIEEDHIVTSISRTISAVSDWEEVLACASNPDMDIVISNTTEVGITLVKDNIHHSPPVSFPGKLLSFLYRRYKVFNGDEGKGMIIIPTELIPGNGEKLKSILLELSHTSGLEVKFIDWLENSNYFCNSLVDRIVPGALPALQQVELENKIGYQDDNLIMSEKYCLWAIESSSEYVKQQLSFADSGEGVFVERGIDKFRELKLRILNGSHTFSAALAYFAGLETVKEAMANDIFEHFISALLFDEIVPTLESESITSADAKLFSSQVLDRFRNPFLDHKWINITAQYSSKMAMRNVATIERFITKYNYVPRHMALGMAAHILFMRCTKTSNGFEGKFAGTTYPVTDANAEIFATAWANTDTDDVVDALLGNIEIWGQDLCEYGEFCSMVKDFVTAIEQKGALEIMQEVAASALNVNSNEK